MPVTRCYAVPPTAADANSGVERDFFKHRLVAAPSTHTCGVRHPGPEIHTVGHPVRYQTSVPRTVLPSLNAGLPRED